MDIDKKRKRKKKKPKALIKNITKKISVLTLTALLLFSSIFSSYDMNVHASESSALEKLLIQIVEDGSVLIGAQTGKAIGDYILPGTGGAVGGFIGGALGGTVAGSLLNSDLDWYANPSESGRSTVHTSSSGTVHGGGGKSFDVSYQYNKGVSTTQNPANYNTTKNMSIYNENKTWNTTTNNYDYTYNWYNPITNTYNTTNEYTYNTTYNTYNYVTHNYDITNNYNYTTNYYIQDNRTYVSYYIINVCDETGEEERDYVEMYYELPDGRNSLYLTVDDIKGQYFPSNYSKYISVAEDDGTTLGLWHLDGDLKDSSYHSNTAGSAFNNVYTDGLYEGAKKFGDNEEDFLELNLDKVDLPNSWTLEWCEYIPSLFITNSGLARPNVAYSTTDYDTHQMSGSWHLYYFSKEDRYLNYDLVLNGYLSFNNCNDIYTPTYDSFVPYAVTFDGSNYCFYRNGVLIDKTDYLAFSFLREYDDNGATGYEGVNVNPEGYSLVSSGLEINDKFIKFNSSRNLMKSIIDNNYVLGRQSPFTNASSGGNRYYSYPIYNVYMRNHVNSIIDEVRLSSGVLYSGDSYTPSSQAFTTNTVLAVPDNPSKHEIAFKTNIDISDVRFGGARPTYPTNGFVYVSLDADDKVESIQQYQEDGWYEIEASLYTGTDWVSFKEVNMEYLGIDGVGDSSGDTGDDSGGNGDDSGGNGGDSGDSSGGGVQAVLDGIGKFFDTLLNLAGKIIGLFSGFVDSVLSLFEGFTVFTDGFSGFLTATFGFLPPEAINVLVSGITLIVILAIIKFLK